MIHRMKYYIKSFYRRIYNVYRWLPIIWNLRDFDYRYAITVFQFQLNNIATFLESDDATTLEAKQHAQQIRDITDRMQRIYDEEYAQSYMDTMTKLYGDFDIEFIPINTKIIDPLTGQEELYEMKKRYAKNYTDDEIAQIETHANELRAECNAKQEEEHTRLWNDINKHIRGWWD
jgi:hypothetical protein